MEKIQFLAFYKNPKFILTFILIVFLLKGAFFATLFPFLQGFDEDKHLATVQYQAEPKEKTWPITNVGESSHGTNYGDPDTFNFSTEEIETAKALDFSKLRMNSLNTQTFADGQFGIEEKTIIQMPWQKYIDKYPPALTGHQKLYYTIASPILKMLWNEDILTRLSTIRLFSILLGALTVLLTYFIAKKIGFSEKISLILASIVAFQPLFSQMSSTINTDNLLTLAFTLFIFGGVSILRDGMDWKNFAITVGALIAGVFTKAPSVVLIPIAYFLFLYAFYKKYELQKSRFIIGAIFITLMLALAAVFLSPYSLQDILISGRTSKFNSVSQSLAGYISANAKKFTSFEISYWGNFGLNNAPISSNFLYIIWPIEAIALLVLLVYLFKKYSPTHFFNPSKKIILFLLSVTLALQIGVRFADWRYFDSYNSLVLKTYGRYFIPTLVSHVLLVALGYLVIFKKEKSYKNFLKLLLILMVTLSFYSIFNLIIPRYYL
jgi:hypothetical protein